MPKGCRPSSSSSSDESVVKKEKEENDDDDEDRIIMSEREIPKDDGKAEETVSESSATEKTTKKRKRKTQKTIKSIPNPIASHTHRMEMIREHDGDVDELLISKKHKSESVKNDDIKLGDMIDLYQLHNAKLSGDAPNNTPPDVKETQNENPFALPPSLQVLRDCLRKVTRVKLLVPDPTTSAVLGRELTTEEARQLIDQKRLDVPMWGFKEWSRQLIQSGTFVDPKTGTKRIHPACMQGTKCRGITAEIAGKGEKEKRGVNLMRMLNREEYKRIIEDGDEDYANEIEPRNCHLCQSYHFSKVVQKLRTMTISVRPEETLLAMPYRVRYDRPDGFYRTYLIMAQANKYEGFFGAFPREDSSMMEYEKDKEGFGWMTIDASAMEWKPHVIPSEKSITLSSSTSTVSRRCVRLEIGDKELKDKNPKCQFCHVLPSSWSSSVKPAQFIWINKHRAMQICNGCYLYLQTSLNHSSSILKSLGLELCDLYHVPNDASLLSIESIQQNLQAIESEQQQSVSSIKTEGGQIVTPRSMSLASAHKKSITPSASSISTTTTTASSTSTKSIQISQPNSWVCVYCKRRVAIYESTIRCPNCKHIRPSTSEENEQPAKELKRIDVVVVKKEPLSTDFHKGVTIPLSSSSKEKNEEGDDDELKLYQGYKTQMRNMQRVRKEESNEIETIRTDQDIIIQQNDLVRLISPRMMRDRRLSGRHAEWLLREMNLHSTVGDELLKGLNFLFGASKGFHYFHELFIQKFNKPTTQRRREWAWNMCFKDNKRIQTVWDNLLTRYTKPGTIHYSTSEGRVNKLEFWMIVRLCVLEFLRSQLKGDITSVAMYHLLQLQDYYWFVPLWFISEKKDQLYSSYISKEKMYNVMETRTDTINERTVYYLDVIEKAFYMNDEEAKKVSAIQITKKVLPKKSAGRKLPFVLGEFIEFDEWLSSYMYQIILCSLLQNYSSSSIVDPYPFELRSFLYRHWTLYCSNPSNEDNKRFLQWVMGTFPRLVTYCYQEYICYRLQHCEYLKEQLNDRMKRYQERRQKQKKVELDVKSAALGDTKRKQQKETKKKKKGKPTINFDTFQSGCKELIGRVVNFMKSPEFLDFVMREDAFIKKLPPKSDNVSKKMELQDKANELNKKLEEDGQKVFMKDHHYANEQHSFLRNIRSCFNSMPPKPFESEEKGDNSVAHINGLSNAQFNSLKDVIFECLYPSDSYPEIAFVALLPYYGVPKAAIQMLQHAMECYLYLGTKVKEATTELWRCYPHTYALAQSFALLWQRYTRLSIYPLTQNHIPPQMAATLYRSRKVLTPSSSSSSLSLLPVEILCLKYCTCCSRIKSYVRDTQAVGERTLDTGVSNVTCDFNPLEIEKDIHRPLDVWCKDSRIFQTIGCRTTPLARLPSFGNVIVHRNKQIIKCGHPLCGVEFYYSPLECIDHPLYSWICGDCTLITYRIGLRNYLRTGRTELYFELPSTYYMTEKEYRDLKPVSTATTSSTTKETVHRRLETEEVLYGKDDFEMYLGNNDDESDQEEEDEKKKYVDSDDDYGDKEEGGREEKKEKQQTKTKVKKREKPKSKWGIDFVFRKHNHVSLSTDIPMCCIAKCPRKKLTKTGYFHSLAFGVSICKPCLIGYKGLMKGSLNLEFDAYSLKMSENESKICIEKGECVCDNMKTTCDGKWNRYSVMKVLQIVHDSYRMEKQALELKKGGAKLKQRTLAEKARDRANIRSSSDKNKK